jgi:outer membrane protein assembly factor BamB
VVSGTTVYVASQDHNLYALNARDGSVKWTFTAGALLVGTPTLYQGTIYAGSFDQNLYAVDATNGTLEWTFEAQGWLWDGPTVYDDTLYFGDLNGNLYAVDLNGRQLWTTQLQGAIRAQPLVTEDRVYVATRQRLLYALDRNTRNPVWPAPFSVEQDGAELLTTPVLVDDRLFITPIPAGNPPIRLYAIQVESGNVVMRFPDPSIPPQ